VVKQSKGLSCTYRRGQTGGKLKTVIVQLYTATNVYDIMAVECFIKLPQNKLYFSTYIPGSHPDTEKF